MRMEQMTLMAGRSAKDQREQHAADMARIAEGTRVSYDEAIAEIFTTARAEQIAAEVRARSAATVCPGGCLCYSCEVRR